MVRHLSSDRWPRPPGGQVNESVSTSPQVLLRPANESDAAFIFDSWLRSYRKGGRSPRVESAVFWDEHRRLLGKLLSRSTVLVACSGEDPAQLFGWLAFERLGAVCVVHYCYTQRVFRRLGVAKKLLEVASSGSGGLAHTHETDAGAPFAKAWRSVYNPYLAGVAT